MAAKQLSQAAQFFWGAVGGLLPALVLIYKYANSQPIGAPIPAIGGLAVVGVVVGAILGAIGSRACDSHNHFTALYHGASAPSLFALFSSLGH